MIDADATGWATSPSQIVNYASCHDNLTLYDKLVASVYGDDEYAYRHEDLVEMNKLSAAIVMMTRGTPFMLAGEEFARTKDGDENSYKSSVKINQLDWSRLKSYTSLVDYYKGLIKLRSMLTALKDPDGSTEVSYLDTSGGECIAYQAVMPRMPIIIAAFNGSDKERATVTLPEGNWVMLADGNRAGLSSLGEFSGTVEVPHTSAVVLVNRAGYKVIGQSDDTATVYARVIDTANNDTILEEKLTGKKGESYSFTVPDEILFRYNFSGDKSLNGTFKKDFDIVSIECEKYEGDYSSVTFRYLDSFDQPISNAIVTTNRVGQQYYSRPLPLLPGYVLDLDKLPDNGAGKYTAEPIVVTYYYKPADSVTAPNAGEEYKCRANIIYMADDGTILDKKSFLGVDGDLVEVEELEFDGYKYFGKSDNYAAFSAVEANIIVNYEKKVFNPLPLIIIGGVSILLLGAIIFYFIGRGKRKKIESIEIDE